MADLLSHVLVAVGLLTVASWHFDWLTDRWIAVGAAGAAIPDLVKVRLLVSEKALEPLLGLEFDIVVLSTLGGLFLVAGAITLLFESHRRRVFGLLITGGCLSLLGDWLRKFASGRSDAWLFPVTWWEPPTPNLYVSSDPLVPAVVIVVVGTVVAVDRFAIGGG